MGKMNSVWHRAHRMPVRATLEQRVKWHRAHARACSCRQMPTAIAAEIERQARQRARGIRRG
jgi:hypothetical protein